MLLKKKYLKFKNTKWVFHGKSKSKSRYNIRKSKTISLVDVSNISQLLSSKHFVLPKNLQPIHGYHPNYMKLVTFNTNLKFKSAGLNSSFKQCLLKRQNNLCPYCYESLSESEKVYMVLTRYIFIILNQYLKEVRVTIFLIWNCYIYGVIMK